MQKLISYRFITSKYSLEKIKYFFKVLEQKIIKCVNIITLGLNFVSVKTLPASGASNALCTASGTENRFVTVNGRVGERKGPWDGSSA